MQTFSGWEYLLIDAANQYGLDKELFEDRIQWANDHLDQLEDLAENKEWKEKPLYLKAVMAIRKAEQGKPTGHLIGFDAVCSGMQIMSALTGCESGADATGLIDPNKRADAYTECTRLMRKRIPTLPDNARKKTKTAVMTSLYGSKAEPKNLFGEGSPELEAFYEAMYEMAPGACELLQDLTDSWQSGALVHEWKLPDGFDARIKVMQKIETRIEVDELDGATFTYEYYENEGSEKGVSNVANVVHSIDAYVLRCLERRCNYDPFIVGQAFALLMNESLRRGIAGKAPRLGKVDQTLFHYYLNQYRRSGVADIVILPHLTKANVTLLGEVHLDRLLKLVEGMVEYAPFPVVTVHDEFKCHANNMNTLRLQYKNILADIAESNLLDDILTQLYGCAGTFPKKSKNLAFKIRQSNYALS